jgi:hypothetical protein
MRNSGWAAQVRKHDRGHAVTWECGDCSRPENPDLKVQWVCHHCGKLLCNDHRRVVLDGAFAGAATSHTRMAVHCQDCRDAYHPMHLPRRLLSR